MNLTPVFMPKVLEVKLEKNEGVFFKDKFLVFINRLKTNLQAGFTWGKSAAKTVLQTFKRGLHIGCFCACLRSSGPIFQVKILNFILTKQTSRA
jgi:hypothetical protein